MPLPKLDLYFVATQFLLFLAYVPNPEALTFTLPAVLHLAGAGLALTGLCTCVLALVQLRTSLSPFPTPVEQGRLVTSGVFRLARHPIYTGLLLMAFGYALYTGSGYRLIISLGLLALFGKKAKYEELLLGVRYAEYEDYQKRVGRFLWFLR